MLFQYLFVIWNGSKIKVKGATVMAAPFVIPMLNSVDFIAEDDDIGDEGEDVACETVEVLVVEGVILIAEDYA